jgi:VanZ family protein
MRRFFHNAKPWSYLFVAWWLGSIALSSLSGKQLEQIPFEWNDKIAHFGYFGCGAWLLAPAILTAQPTSTAVRWIAPLVIMLVSALDETYQLVTPGRSGADIADFVADSIGGLIGSSVSIMMHRHAKTRQRQEPD